MRRPFLAALVELARQDPRVALLVADLGYTVVEPFAEAFPARFFNVGVAEQNLIGVATGLAEAGFIPFCYSIATFAALRPYEFIRNGPALHGLPVRIVGAGGGLEYGPAGATHHALEDVGVLRTLPGLRVLAPADSPQAVAALRASWDLPGPTYYRLGKDDQALLPGLEGRFRLDQVECVREGADLALLALGAIASETLRAADRLAREGISARVVVVPQLAPAPDAALREVLGDVPLALTHEAHVPAGGLGSLVAEVIAEAGLQCRLVRCAARPLATPQTGSRDFLRRAHGISAEDVAARAREALA
ncbi:MAG: transketolase family protein [Planctomycetota bacterium]